MFNETFVMEQYKEVLSELWQGSGYSLDSIRKRLDKDFTNGCDRAYDNSCNVYHFKNFSVVVSPCCYYFVERI